MDREVLMLHLRQAFGGTPAERRTVARAAGDLADAGKLGADLDAELTAEFVLEHLSDAPKGTPAERWNWWMGALEASHGGYRRFRVTAWEREE
ncbi:hypothetical protein [Halobacterium litoreum]|uniref:Uncharacterized protein n=1 Tax=Halobacterium litoreum TaxID=2039234 RepID=A0ABD5NFK8_9EURY|nr:hypothetical protein [Halobacterium litoreum]UHH13122.1 hypothetical protein LT972_13290 [Halobacterium litoreum]